jgi:ABC-type lipoprotein release transport system permease subunit
VFVAISLTLLVVTVLSSAIPANRAASIEPADALQAD